MTRLSHSACRPCDVMFLTAPTCPRCYGTDLIHPPTGSPPLPANTPRGGRRWIERDEDTRDAARVDNGCIHGHDPEHQRYRPDGRTTYCRKCAAQNRARKKAS